MSKTQIFIITLAILVLAGFVWYTNNNNPSYTIDQSDMINSTLVQDIEPEELNEEEVRGLVLMREEEKLAKDIYTTLYDTWNLQIFKNIAASEQTHTNAVKVLLERYDIDDPVTDESIGVFTSPILQNIYDSFVEQGKLSVLDALRIGATVEDLDIRDLNNLLMNTDNEDIIITYNNLVRGSRNHLRAFYKQIQSNGGEYIPTYISQDEFDTIVGSSPERGRGR